MFALRELYATFTIAAILSTCILLWLHSSKFSTNGVLYWASAMCSFSIGQLLITLRGYLPFCISFTAANNIMLLGFLLLWIGIRKFLNLSITWRIYLFGAVNIATATALLYWFTTITPSVTGRAGAVSLCALPYTIFIAHNLLTNTRQYNFTWIFGLANAFYAIVHLSHLCKLISVSPLTDGHPDTWIAPYTAWAIVYLFFATVTFIMLTIEDTYKKQSAVEYNDPLTGLFNRKALRAMTLAQDASSSTEKNNLAMLALDIDCFKEINTTFGHIAGDQILQDAAAKISSMLRAEDLVFRVGGKRFLILSPSYSAEQALMLAEKIRTSIAQQPYKLDSLSIPYTVSIGYTVMNTAADSMKKLLHQTNSALHTAQKHGGNRTERFIAENSMQAMKEKHTMR
ncbi:GGDEF domain-containing protein [Halodesulfovibrio sp.]|uniref:GGDEF domain-containing protein n=1 Tax=Halodesulfovibrio sp. TaxID=1912772 RepID=UPI0025F0DE07|nr:GGDEF domain-containing protein [Halodesulfovibrio sp.]MCT4534378.1 GGDEF domain-containing protein [Halodesulfovibrio sp.]